jgi:hypothetical protein
MDSQRALRRLGEISMTMLRQNLSAAFKDQADRSDRPWNGAAAGILVPTGGRRSAVDPEGRHDEFSAALQ